MKAPSANGKPRFFAKLPHWLVEDTRLSPIDHRVIAILATFAVGNRLECWPSLRKLSAKVQRTEQVVRLSLKNLAHFGYIRCEADGSKRTHWTIRLLWKTLDGPTPDPDGLSPRKTESRRVGSYQRTRAVGDVGKSHIKATPSTNGHPTSLHLPPSTPPPQEWIQGCVIR
jgi:hypothetical protein